MSASNSEKVIEVVVGPTGATKIETRGFEGGACQGADAFLRKALGKAATERLKPEFYAEPVRQECSHHVRD